MITITSYPLVQFTNTNTEEGIFTKRKDNILKNTLCGKVTSRSIYMITITSYPLVQFTNTNTEEGIFTKKTLLFKSFLTNKTNTILVSTKQNKIASFIKPIKQKHNGFLIEMLFHGFNYSAKRLKLFRSKYYIDTHKSEIFICEEPAAITFKSRI